MNFVYLLILGISISGLAVLDFKYKLAIAKTRRYLCVILISVLFFLVWDVAGISLGIFFRGGSQLQTGILLAPELPLEEIFFLSLLNYSALLLIKAIGRK
ncbi:MAG: lycopene cyclase domain-containing protein [Rhodoluna sp.]